MHLSLNSKRIALGADYIKDVSAVFGNQNNMFSGGFSVQELQFAGLSLYNNTLQLLADDNHVGASYSYDNQSDMENRGELVINADLSRENGRLDALATSYYFR